MKTMAWLLMGVTVTATVAVVGTYGVTKRLLVAESSEKCIQIFYDSKKEARLLQKYLQGFGDFQQYLISIDHYERGDVDRCQATLYVNSREEGAVPRIFAEDYVSAERNVAWVGHNIWQLGDRLERVFGLRYIGLASSTGSDVSEIFYKGQSFRRRGAPEKQVELLAVNSRKFEVLAELRRENSRELLPYVVRSKNRFYMSELPVEGGFHSEQGPLLRDLLAEMVGVPPHDRARTVTSNSR